MTRTVYALAVLDASRASDVSHIIASLYDPQTRVVLTPTLVSDDNLVRAAALRVTREVSVSQSRLMDISVETMQRRVETSLRQSIKRNATVTSSISRPADQVVSSAHDFDLVVIEAHEQQRFYAVADQSDALFVKAPWDNGGAIVVSEQADDHCRRLASSLAHNVARELVTANEADLADLCRQRTVQLVATSDGKVGLWDEILNASTSLLVARAPTGK